MMQGYSSSKREEVCVNRMRRKKKVSSVGIPAVLSLDSFPSTLESSTPKLVLSSTRKLRCQRHDICLIFLNKPKDITRCACLCLTQTECFICAVLQWSCLFAFLFAVYLCQRTLSLETATDFPIGSVLQHVMACLSSNACTRRLLYKQFIRENTSLHEFFGSLLLAVYPRQFSESIFGHWSWIVDSRFKTQVLPLNHTKVSSVFVWKCYLKRVSHRRRRRPLLRLAMFTKNSCPFKVM